MSSPTPQTLANHTRLDPPFHFFLVPVYGISWILSLVLAVRHPTALPIWEAIFVTALLGGLFKTRLYALKVQDRVIRLEERLRLAALLPDSTRAQALKLTEKQLVALRFASDEELSALAQQALTENLPPAEIKKLIRNWRPDYWRV
jgi:hypothetical protein